MCRRPIYQCQVILNAFFPQYLFGACPFCEEPCHVSKSQRSAVLVLWACACILSILWYTKSGSCIDFPLDWPNPASKVGKWFWVSPRCSERLLRLQSSSCYAEGLPFAFFFLTHCPWMSWRVCSTRTLSWTGWRWRRPVVEEVFQEDWWTCNFFLGFPASRPAKPFCQNCSIFWRKREAQRQFCEKTVSACLHVQYSAIKMAEAIAGETQLDFEQAALSRRTPFMTGSWRRKKRQPGAEVLWSDHCFSSDICDCSYFFGRSLHTPLLATIFWIDKVASLLRTISVESMDRRGAVASEDKLSTAVPKISGSGYSSLALSWFDLCLSKELAMLPKGVSLARNTLWITGRGSWQMKWQMYTDVRMYRRTMPLSGICNR